MATARRKLSFKNVSSVVVQLLHSIKYNVDVPFANMTMSAGHPFGHGPSSGNSGLATMMAGAHYQSQSNAERTIEALNGASGKKTAPTHTASGGRKPFKVCPEIFTFDRSSDVLHKPVGS